MANAIKWEAAWASPGTVLTTELDALAAGSRTNVGSEYANQTSLNQIGCVLIDVDFASAPAAGGHLRVYMVQALDGTNYEDGSASVEPSAAALVAVIDILASTAAQKRRSGPILLLPGKTKFLIENLTDQPFPSSGSTLTLFVTNDEIQ